MKILFYSTLTALILGTTLNACKKEDDPDDDTQ